MITQLFAVTVLVRDQDEALAFYTEKLGLEKRADMQMGPDARWLTVVPAGQTTPEIVLLKPGAWHSEEETQRLMSRVGQGTTWIFLTDDCRAEYETLRGRGVKFISEPKEEPYGVEAIFEDLYGNQFSLTQPAPMSM